MKIDINKVDMALTFINATGATSISYGNITIAKCGKSYCYIEKQVLKARAFSVDPFKKKVKKLL